MIEAIFIPDGDTLIPQPTAAGPWFPGVQHGGAVTGLMARAIEQVPAAQPMMLTRMSVDMSRKVPMGPTRVVAHVLRDGRRLTAVQLQLEFLQAAAGLPDAAGDQATKEVLAEWERVLVALESDPQSLADELDWVAKYSLMQQYRRRDGLDWDSHRLQLIDLQYSDVDPARGLALQLERRGRLRRLTDDAEVDRAVDAAPVDTRAWFRGECIRRYSAQVAAAGWDSVVFDVPGRHALQRVPTMDPLRGTRAHVGALLEQSATAAELVDALAGT